MRDGSEQKLPAEAPVPGDIILVVEADAIQADARLMDVTAQTAQEAGFCLLR